MAAEDPDIKDRKGSQPKKYHTGLAKSTKTKRDAHFKKGAKMDDDNAAAYKPAPGDADAKTKPSSHTKKFKDMYGEEKNHEEVVIEDAGKALKNKADKTGMPVSILRKVYNRGVAAWRTGHRPGTTPEQWGLARVNSFVTKSSGTWGKADADLAAKVRNEEVDEDTTTDIKSFLSRMTQPSKYKKAIRLFLDLRKKNPNSPVQNLRKTSQMTGIRIPDLDKVFRDMVKKGQMPKHLIDYPSFQLEEVDLDEGAVISTTVRKEIMKNGGKNVGQNNKEIYFTLKGKKHSVPLYKNFVSDKDYMKMQDTLNEAVDPSDTGGAEEVSMAKKQIAAMRHYLDGIESSVKAKGDMEEWYQNKLTKANDYLKTLYGYAKGDVAEEVDLDEATFKVDVEGLPTFYMDAPSQGKVNQALRKLLRKASSIDDVSRTTTTKIRQDFRDRVKNPTSDSDEDPSDE